MHAAYLGTMCRFPHLCFTAETDSHLEHHLRRKLSATTGFSLRGRTRRSTGDNISTSGKIFRHNSFWWHSISLGNSETSASVSYRNPHRNCASLQERTTLQWRRISVLQTVTWNSERCNARSRDHFWYRSDCCQWCAEEIGRYPSSNSSHSGKTWCSFYGQHVRTCRGKKYDQRFPLDYDNPASGSPQEALGKIPFRILPVLQKRWRRPLWLCTVMKTWPGLFANYL